MHTWKMECHWTTLCVLFIYKKQYEFTKVYFWSNKIYLENRNTLEKLTTASFSISSLLIKSHFYFHYV